MTVLSEGIVLSLVRYGDHSSVVGIYTREEGLQSFMVKGIGKKNGRFRNAYFFPLSQVELVYTRTKPSGLLFIKEIRNSYVYRNLYTDIRKSTVAMFLSEIMSKTITQSEQDYRFYDRMSALLKFFDEDEANVAEFHLYFLLELASSMGFCPSLGNHGAEAYFDFNEGCFTSCIPPHTEYIGGITVADLHCLVSLYLDESTPVSSRPMFPSSRRTDLLRCLVRYIQIQAGWKGDLSSLEILHEVFS